MRAYEFITESPDRKPDITLRNINNMKRAEKRRLKWHDSRKGLITRLYGNPAFEQDEVQRRIGVACGVFPQSAPILLGVENAGGLIEV